MSGTYIITRVHPDSEDYNNLIDSGMKAAFRTVISMERNGIKKYLIGVIVTENTTEGEIARKLPNFLVHKMNEREQADQWIENFQDDDEQGVYYGSVYRVGEWSE